MPAKADPAPRHRVTVLTEAPAWRRRLPDAATRIRRAANAALRSAGPRRRAELAIVLTDDARQQVLNRTWRGKDRPTNVLAFPAHDDSVPPDVPLPLGDVVLAFETVAREAADQGKTFGDHVSHLVIHGVLHLLGHDHDRSSSAIRMERLETELLAEMGIANPYRTATPETSTRTRGSARAVAR